MFSKVKKKFLKRSKVSKGLLKFNTINCVSKSLRLYTKREILLMNFFNKILRHWLQLRRRLGHSRKQQCHRILLCGVPAGVETFRHVVGTPKRPIGRSPHDIFVVLALVLVIGVWRIDRRYLCAAKLIKI